MILFFLAAIAVVVIALLAQAANKKQTEARQKAMMELATNLSLEYVLMMEPSGCMTFGAPVTFVDPFSMRSGRTDEITAAFRSFTPFGQGSSQTVQNLIVGPRHENQWMLFDYQYTVSSGKSSTTYYFGIVTVMMPLAMPQLEIRPAGMMDSISGFFGAKDIQFESDEFNRQFAIHCDDEKRAYDIIDPQMMEFLMSIPRYTFQICGDQCVIALSGKQEPAAYYQCVTDLEGFLQRIPNFVRQDIGFKPNWPTSAN